ncbi:hypothetical protein G3O06_05415 [Burkholderia sp. Ac-20345]|uniref:hypothetical protein n=1 Tax=Burkholderia sp. Ac-20345 TaxID=2703891 RepID=UPI00197B1EFA|nr:hypothetical protein [Burkholderia sp. Ac-20345]MBN3777008.1 hypothetical protein [Burkholderia sp. Ac-20345]
MSERFSKPNMIAALERRAEALQKKHGFNPNNGTAQLTGPLATQEAAVAYGDFRLTLDLIQWIEDGSFFRH